MSSLERWNVRVGLSFKTDSPTLGVSRPLTNTVRSQFVRRVSESLKSNAITLLSRSDLQGNQDIVGVIGSQSDESHIALLSQARQGGHGYHNGGQSQSSNQNILTLSDRWHWLIDHDAPRSKIGSLLNSRCV